MYIRHLFHFGQFCLTEWVSYWLVADNLAPNGYAYRDNCMHVAQNVLRGVTPLGEIVFSNIARQVTQRIAARNSTFSAMNYIYELYIIYTIGCPKKMDSV